MTDLPELQWFPKPFGPGDTDGTGLQRSMGMASYPNLDILIRETAQNSWDARLGGEVIPEFEMRLWTLGSREVNILRRNVFGQASESSGLMAALEADELTAIEVADRGTKGLGGPTRNDLAFEEGSSRDYANFVLTVGAPPGATGGGTYGFGKTATYSASSCDTVLIWSKCRNPLVGGYEERFVASAMGTSFVRDGLMYTGRQWWGHLVEDAQGRKRIEPVTGEDAASFGRALFERHFDEEETGTSLLILAPKADRLSSEDSELATVQLWRQAVQQHLWPKLSEEQDPLRRMTIRLFDHGRQVPVLESDRSSDILDAAQQCLAAIRDKQANREHQNLCVLVKDIRSLSPKQLLGHLALNRVGRIDEDDEFFPMADNVTYMRSAAELVVNTRRFGEEPHALSHWVGVFKPVPEVDDHFAQSEPPAHDVWKYESMQDATAKGAVRRALNKIREAMAEYLRPVTPDVSGEGAKSTGALSVALAGLAGAAEGTVPIGPSVRSKAGRRPRKSLKPKVHLDGEPNRYFRDDDPDRQYVELPLRIEAPGPVWVSPSRLAIAVEGASMDAGTEVRLEGWSEGGRIKSNDPELLVDGNFIDVVFSHPRGTAIEVDFKLEVDA